MLVPVVATGGYLTYPARIHAKNRVDAPRAVIELPLGRLRMPEGHTHELMRKRGLKPPEPYVILNTPWRRGHTCGEIVPPRSRAASRGLGTCMSGPVFSRC